ncbi:MAG: carbohydrate binding domain-containing protein [Sedimentisphaeraceae bacterium JB056]
MKMNKNTYCRFAVLTVLSLSVCCFAVSTQDVMGFESAQNIWVTEADLSQFVLSELRCERVESGSYSRLRNAAELSDEYVKQGQYSLKWSQINEFPSLSTVNIDHDWSGYNTIAFWVYSKEITNQKIYLVLHSDSPQTDWKDFYYKALKIDWQGWKRLDMPLTSFNEYETPAGLGKIDGVGFYAKLFYARPNPYTVLYLDDMQLLDVPPHDINRDRSNDLVDLSVLADQWQLKLAAEEDFESALLGDDISSAGWYSIYGSVTSDVLIEQFETGVKAASVIYGNPAGKYRKNFTGNNLASSDRYVYMSADITPIKYAGSCYDIWAGFWAKFFAGVYVGFTPSADSSSWQCAVTKAGGGTVLTDDSYTVAGNHQYRLRLQMDTQSYTGSLFIKDLTNGETSYSMVPGLQNVDLAFTSSNNPSKWEKFYIDVSHNGRIDNIVLGSGNLSVSYPPLAADINLDRVVSLEDMKLFAQNWLTAY